MTEYKTLSFGDTFAYKGLINLEGFYKILDKWLKDNGYDKVEIWNHEEVFETGKQCRWKFQPYKKISDLAKIEIRINASFTNLKEVTVEKNKIKHKLMKGEASVSFDTFLCTDYENYWGTKPLYFFLKILADKFLYRSYIERFEETAIKDKEALKRELRSYLNMQRF